MSRYAEGVGGEGEDGNTSSAGIAPLASIPLSRLVLTDELESVQKIVTRATECFRGLPSTAEGSEGEELSSQVFVTANELLLAAAKLETLARMLGAGGGQ